MPPVWPEGPEVSLVAPTTRGLVLVQGRVTHQAYSDRVTDRSLSEAMDDFNRVVLQRDVELAERVLDVDYHLVLVQPVAAAMPRARWIEVLPDYFVSAYAVEESRIDVDGDTAAVLQRVQMTATVLGEDRSGTFVLSDIWRLRNDGWRIWRRHSSPLSAGRMPGE